MMQNLQRFHDNFTESLPSYNGLKTPVICAFVKFPLVNGGGGGGGV